MPTAIDHILSRCGTKESVLPRTELFNEGWMLRLVLDWLDRNREHPHVLAFEPGARWYSEALLPSRFLPRHRGDPLAEAFTHADGVIGHFAVRSGVRGDAELEPQLTQFVVTEAKLASQLSAGTKNAPSFDQAARNVACMAHMLGVKQIDPRSVKRLAFYVLAPQSQVEAGIFAQPLAKDSLRSRVRERVAAYDGAHDRWFEETFLPTVEHIQVGAISWEQVLQGLPISPERADLEQFYAQCKAFNPLRGASAV
jgi:hypothetical protein